MYHSSPPLSSILTLFLFLQVRQIGRSQELETMKLNLRNNRLVVLSAALVGAVLASTASAFVVNNNNKASLISSRQQHNLAFVKPQVNKHVPSRSALFMGWGPDPIWSTAEVTSSETANQSGNTVLITVSVPAETAQEYKIPGQYVQVRLNEDTKPLFLAIASPPDAENAVFEFLVKKTDGNEWMTGASAGSKIEVSQVLGGGFPMAENLDGFKYDFPTQNVLLFGAGSGIAPLRAAMESGQLDVAKAGSGGRTARLYYGVQTADDLCFVDKCKF